MLVLDQAGGVAVPAKGQVGVVRGCQGGVVGVVGVGGRMVTTTW